MPEEESTGAWTCNSCRECIFDIHILKHDLSALRNLCELILSTVREKDKEITVLNAELADARAQIEDKDNQILALRTAMQEQTDCASSPSAPSHQEPTQPNAHPYSE